MKSAVMRRPALSGRQLLQQLYNAAPVGQWVQRVRAHACRRYQHSAAKRTIPQDGKTLQQFASTNRAAAANTDADDLTLAPLPSNVEEYVATDDKVRANPRPKTYYIETYGCAMNVADSELVASILQTAGYERTTNISEAGHILLNTCAIRDGAENKVRARLSTLNNVKRPKLRIVRGKEFNSAFAHHQRHDQPPPMIIVLGCMAERLKQQLLAEERSVDIVVGPDEYRSLPRLMDAVENEHGSRYAATLLSVSETYHDLKPLRMSDKNNVSALVSISRGCSNLCSFCVVPFTRGQLRSRDPESIIDEVRELRDRGFKEITLLGQNVTSYNYYTERKLQTSRQAPVEGFTNIARQPEVGVSFAQLLDRCSAEAPEVRFRFTSPHPKDTTDELLQLIATRPNICKQFHLPAQSGSTTCLQRMRRGYSREAYMALVQRMRNTIGPELSLSTDMIVGFCGETDEEFQDTLSLMRDVQFDSAYMFAYSQRTRTHAYHKMQDDVPADIKSQRVKELVSTFHHTLQQRSDALVDSIQLVLIDSQLQQDGIAKLTGKADSNRRCFMPLTKLPTVSATNNTAVSTTRVPAFGDYVIARVTKATALSCVVEPLAITTLTDYHQMQMSSVLSEVMQTQLQAQHAGKAA